MRKIIAVIIFTMVLILAGYTYWFYFNSYSDGYREGILQKFSRRGNIFKTNEGEMVLLGFGQRSNGMINSNFFYFSVTDKSLADSLDKCMGKSMRLHYIQYRKSLPWRGDNYNGKNSETGQYVVDHIDNVKDATVY